jgi:hypothetical protein
MDRSQDGNARLTLALMEAHLESMLISSANHRTNPNTVRPSDSTNQQPNIVARAIVPISMTLSVLPTRRAAAASVCSARSRRVLPPAVASQYLFRDKNRCHMDKSQSKRPPERTQRPPHLSISSRCSLLNRCDCRMENDSRCVAAVIL